MNLISKDIDRNKSYSSKSDQIETDLEMKFVPTHNYKKKHSNQYDLKYQKEPQLNKLMPDFRKFNYQFI